jgi:hypothetical protein
MEEVADIHAITYHWKRKAIFHRTTKKRRITLDFSILITTEENLINTDHAKMSILISARMEITNSTQDRDKRDEEELAISLKELENLRHLRNTIRTPHSHGVPKERIPGGLQQIYR